jgi:transcriptional regulator with XRE-family HTH domain
MVKKNKIPKALRALKLPAAAGFTIPEIPPGERVILPGPGILKRLRERVGLSQSALAQECQVSRDVIANLESGRTKLNQRSLVSIEDRLKVWRALELKERAINLPREKGESTARDAVLGLLWLAKGLASGQLVEIDGQIENLKRKRESVVRQISELESEEAHFKNRPA